MNELDAAGGRGASRARAAPTRSSQRSEEFLTGARHAPEADRVLATVLFTDIVSSSTHAAGIGDQRWRDLLGSYEALGRRELARFRGREVKNLSDGALLGIEAPQFQTLLPAVEKDPPPLLDLMHGHLDLAGDLVNRFTPHDPQHHFRLALRAPPLGQLLASTLRRHARL